MMKIDFKNQCDSNFFYIFEFGENIRAEEA